MVGDWVQLKTYGVSDKFERTEVYIFVKVVQIGGGFIIAEYNNDILEPYRICVNTEIEPILLTPEILEKNGFKKCAGNEWSVFKYEDDDYTKKALYQVLWYADELYLEIVSYTSRIGEFDRMGVEFVHQLQHAMRICGIEKEIEL